MALAEAQTSFSEDLELITKAAIEAGNLALPYFRGDTDMDIQIKAGNSPVSAADYAVNAYLEQQLKDARPEYGWLSEETVDKDAQRRVKASRTFIVDPIDGTRGFIQGRNQWCISISVVENGRPIVGVLVCPARDEVFHASLGGGAYLNQQPIKLGAERPDRIILGGPRVFLDVMDAKSDDVFERHMHVPSLAYRIALVASGRLTATFVKPNAHDWDVAAADLILHEAGGTLCDEHGKKLQLNQQNVVKSVMCASHPSMLDDMLAIVRETPFR